MDYSPMDSKFLRARGRCCKSACLHCPYGFTLKRFGLKFEKIENLKDEDLLRMVEAPVLIDERQSYQKVFLKDELCAIVKVNHIIVLELYHVPSFEDQGLDKEVVESYFFY